MALAPDTVRVKRKRTDEPIDSLFLQFQANKRISSNNRILFKRQTDVVPLNGQVDNAHQASPPANKTQPQAPPIRRRVFKQLQQPSERGLKRPAHVVFVEDKGPDAASALQSSALAQSDPEARPRKRPTTKAPRGNNNARTEQDAPNEALQNAMQEMAVQYEANSKGQPTATDEDAMEITTTADESEYVYDVFHQTSAPPGEDIDEHIGDYWTCIGYGEAIMTPWFGGSDAGSEENDFESDQDDENAETFYGADYPDEDLDPDDENDADPYRFAANQASDDEDYESEGDFLDLGDRYPWGKRLDLSAADDDDDDEDE